MKKILSAILLFVCFQSVKAQQCGFETTRTFSSNYKQKETTLNNLLYNKVKNDAGKTKSARSVVTIPVVVHIIHQYGPENLSDAQVIAGINEMNLRYQNSAPYFDATGTPVNIQFCLAQIDPQGNVTTGITRDYSPLTYLWGSNDVQMKNLNRWDPYYYYNVWIVHSIYGFNISVSGYSSLPSNIGDAMDGVVIDYTSINGTVLTHESGHYLGLYHTFEGGCTNYNCMLDGDGVCDTPPDSSTSVCMGNSCSSEMNDTSGFNPFMGDVNDLPNYMDYTPCPLSFSQGQADRMNNALSVIRYQLLQSAGCGFAGGPPPVAQLGYVISPCNDGVVQFIDSLSSNTNTVNWDFNNDGIWDSYAHNPEYTFPSTGTYTVKLTVAGQGGANTVYQTIFVQKGPSLYYPITTLGSIFTNSNGQLTSCPGYTNNLTSAHAVSYLWSTGDTTQSITFNPTSTYTITLTIVDSMGHTWTNQLCHPLTVNVHPAPPTANIYTNDPLTNCVGDVSVLHSGVNADSTNTLNWYQNSQPLNAHDTMLTVTGYNTGVYYQLIIGDTNGCYSWSNYVYISSYSPPITQSLTQNGLHLSTGWGNGNQWYLNGVAIPGANGMTYTATQNGCYQDEWFFSFAPNCTTMSDSICIYSVGVNELHPEAEGVVVSPVPAQGSFTIEIQPSWIGASYSVFDPLGKLITSGILKSERTNFSAIDFAQGVYNIQVTLNGKLENRKILISH